MSETRFYPTYFNKELDGLLTILKLSAHQLDPRFVEGYGYARVVTGRLEARFPKSESSIFMLVGKETMIQD